MPEIWKALTRAKNTEKALNSIGIEAKTCVCIKEDAEGEYYVFVFDYTVGNVKKKYTTFFGNDEKDSVDIHCCIDAVVEWYIGPIGGKDERKRRNQKDKEIIQKYVSRLRRNKNKRKSNSR